MPHQQIGKGRLYWATLESRTPKPFVGCKPFTDTLDGVEPHGT